MALKVLVDVGKERSLLSDPFRWETRNSVA
jgi:hypothetical protein